MWTLSIHRIEDFKKHQWWRWNSTNCVLKDTHDIPKGPQFFSSQDGRLPGVNKWFGFDTTGTIEVYKGQQVVRGVFVCLISLMIPMLLEFNRNYL